MDNQLSMCTPATAVLILARNASCTRSWNLTFRCSLISISTTIYQPTCKIYYRIKPLVTILSITEHTPHYITAREDVTFNILSKIFLLKLSMKFVFKWLLSRNIFRVTKWIMLLLLTNSRYDIVNLIVINVIIIISFYICTSIYDFYMKMYQSNIIRDETDK